MSVPEVGARVPEFALPQHGSGQTQRLAELVQRGPTLVAFFKKSCATSRLALPFVERLHQHYPALQLVGISQDDAAETQAFVEQAGLTFPVVLDQAWNVSREYDLFTVPSLFLLDGEGVVRQVNMGWNKEQYSALGERVAQLLQVEAHPLVRDDDKVPVFKPG